MLRQYLPEPVREELFGERAKYGKQAWQDDPDWQVWISHYTKMYEATQRSSLIQTKVNNAGYRVMAWEDFNAKAVAEIGPGNGYHLKHFPGNPSSYSVLDVCTDFFPVIEHRCEELGIPVTCHAVETYTPAIPLPSASQDIFLSFYSMEHLHPLEGWLSEIFRVLKPGGVLLGAIPTEGGLAWGLGRWLTSRRILKKQLNLDIKKIVCWEHPNTCDEILAAFRQHGTVRQALWPFSFLNYDTGLVIKFMVTKQEGVSTCE